MPAGPHVDSGLGTAERARPLEADRRCPIADGKPDRLADPGADLDSISISFSDPIFHFDSDRISFRDPVSDLYRSADGGPRSRSGDSGPAAHDFLQRFVLSQQRA